MPQARVTHGLLWPIGRWPATRLDWLRRRPPRPGRAGNNCPSPKRHPRAPSRPTPWAPILEAGAALSQGLATSRTAGEAAAGAAPIAIEPDPVTGQASVRLPTPDVAGLQRLAKALKPWLR